ncbi:MAG: PKD domain-containing protein [Candidatus Nanohaloarchaea archaeon]
MQSSMLKATFLLVLTVSIIGSAAASAPTITSHTFSGNIKPSSASGNYDVTVDWGSYLLYGRVEAMLLVADASNGQKVHVIDTSTFCDSKLAQSGTSRKKTYSGSLSGNWNGGKGDKLFINVKVDSANAQNYGGCLDYSKASNKDNVVKKIDTLQNLNSAPSGDFSFKVLSTESSTKADNKDLVRFKASGSDPDGDSLTYKWDFTNDGSIDTKGKTIDHRFTYTGDGSSMQSKTTRLVITDGSKSVTIKKTIKVEPPALYHVGGALNFIAEIEPRYGGYPGFDGLGGYVTSYYPTLDTSRGSFFLQNFKSGSLEYNPVSDTTHYQVKRWKKNRCYLGLYESDAAHSEMDQVAYEPGTVIQRDGHFPAISSHYVTDPNSRDKLDQESIYGPGIPQLYKDLATQGFTNDQMNRDADLMEFSQQSGKSVRFQMQGDLLCNDFNGDGVARWASCTPSLNHGSGGSVGSRNVYTDTTISSGEYQGTAYHCVGFARTWTDQPACSDGFDNDHDGAVDTNDNQCTGPNDNSESVSLQCDNPGPQIAELNFKYGGITYTEKGALWNADSSGEWHRNTTGACHYKNFQVKPYYDASSQTPYQFYCYGDRQANIDEFKVNAPGGISSSNDRNNNNIPDDLEDNLNYCQQNYAGGNIPGMRGNNISVVEYYVPKNAIPTGRNRFATKHGLKNKFFQPLNKAENEFYNKVRTGNCGAATTYTSGGSSLCYYSPVNNISWDAYGIQDMADMQISSDIDNDGVIEYDDGYTYAGDSKTGQKDYLDSWAVANAGNNTTYVANPPLVKHNIGDGVFPGGFVPKCKDAELGRKWRYVNGGWECSYPPKSGDIKVNFFNLKPDIGKIEVGEPISVGFRINKSQMKKWKGPYLSPDGSDSRVDPVVVHSQCWHGGPGERPTGDAVTENITNTTVTYHGNGPVIVAMNVTKRGNVDHADTYSCLFGFQQHIVQSLSGTKYRDLVQGGVVHDRVNYFFSGINSKDSSKIGRINDPISITTGGMLDINQSDLNLYNPAASNTKTSNGKVLSPGTGPFQDFTWSLVGESEQSRNPLSFYCYVHGNC